MSENPIIVKSASRVLEILEFVVAHNATRPTFTAILNQFNIPKSSLSYLLQELVNQNYINYDPASRAYYPGLKLIQLSAACLNNSNIFEEILLGIKKLSDATGETAHAAVLSGRYITYISKVQGKEYFGLRTLVGLQLPAHATAVGKLLLSSLPESKFEELMQGVTLEKITENTTSDIVRLRKELKIIQQQGFALESQESTIGACCVAGPIFDNTNKMIAAISVTFLASRATQKRFQEYTLRVTAAAKSISQLLGNSDTLPHPWLAEQKNE